MSSADHLRQLGTEELCQWLRDTSALNQKKLQASIKVIGEQEIDGANFLSYTYDAWVSKPCNLPGGVAMSLVQIAQEILLDEEKTQEINQKHRVQIFKSDEQVVNFLAQFKVSPQPVDRFLEFDTKTLLDEVYSDSYLKLPMKGKDTTAAPRFSIVAPIGSGKTKFIHDLAFVKKVFVIYIDWKIYEDLLGDIRNTLKLAKRTFDDRKAVFRKFLRGLMYLGNLILEQDIVTDEVDFFKFWTSSPYRVIETLSRLDDQSVSENQAIIFAFDECQNLLEPENGIDCGNRRITPSFFTYLFEAAAVYNNNRVVFSGTSLRISVMLEKLSPLRKELFIPKHPPLFTSQTVQRYLTSFKVSAELIEKVKDSLVGRALCCRYFVEEYEKQKTEPRSSILLGEVGKRLKAHFYHHMRDYACTKTWLGHTVVNGRSRRDLLIELMSCNELSYPSIHEKDITDFIESVNSALLPIHHSGEKFRYRSHDLLAYHVLLDILNETEGDLDF